MGQKETPRLKMKLRFDAEQVTNSLNYEFLDSNGSIFQNDGRCAGTFYFPDNAIVDVEVFGTAKTEHQMRFSVSDLTIVCVPRFRPHDSILSPFDKDSACVRVGEWELPKAKQKGDLTRLKMKSRQKLWVVEGNGQWEVSGYLSVLIERIHSDGKTKTHSRLFRFDPEGTMGSGGDIDE